MFSCSPACAQSANPPVDAPAQVSSPTAAQIDAAVHGVLESTGVPSASIAIVESGRIVYLHAYGEARLAPPTPAQPAMQYSVGSISKQFTAAAVLLLAEQGKLASTIRSRSICRISPARGKSPCACFSRIPRDTRTSGRRTMS